MNERLTYCTRIFLVLHATGNTAVRATQRHMKISTFYRYVGKLYSLYQFLAIGSHILPQRSNARLADLAYNAIIAIQSSAFMMTLYRKVPTIPCPPYLTYFILPTHPT